jgi:hypothetical protein
MLYVFHECRRRNSNANTKNEFIEVAWDGCWPGRGPWVTPPTPEQLDVLIVRKPDAREECFGQCGCRVSVPYSTSSSWAAAIDSEGMAEIQTFISPKGMKTKMKTAFRPKK